MRKILAELIGTMVLTLFGCGTAVFFCDGTPAGVLITAIAFGLSIVAMAYAIGDVSGCHINPAVTLGCLLTRRIGFFDAIKYWVAQFVGGIAGAAILLAIIKFSGIDMANTGFGTNSYDAVGMVGGIVTEIILTCVFVLTILGVTGNKNYSSKAGLVIGFTLTFVHILGIPLTGTSVNPARSLGVAIFKGGSALSQVWVFIVAPLAGAVIAALIYNIVVKASQTEKKAQ